MTLKISLFFECPVCKKLFQMEVSGHWLKTCYYQHSDFGLCFYDYNLGEIHKNSILNPVKDKHKCGVCDKSYQLEEFL